MIIQEWISTDDGSLRVDIKMDSSKGDRCKMFERNKSHDDVPLAVCYNMGMDFNLRTTEEQRARVMAMLKMLRVAFGQAVEDVGSMVGAKGHMPIAPHEIGEAGGPGGGGMKQ